MVNVIGKVRLVNNVTGEIRQRDISTVESIRRIVRGFRKYGKDIVNEYSEEAIRVEYEVTGVHHGTELKSREAGLWESTDLSGMHKRLNAIFNWVLNQTDL